MEIDTLIKDLGLRKVKIREEEIMASCPFAKITHASGYDEHPSFSINIEKGVYNCFTCGAKGIIEDLIAKTQGISMSQAIDYLENLGLSRIEILSHTYLHEEEEEETIRYIPEMVLENYNKLSEPYEMYEGIVDGRECVIFVVRDYKCRLVGAIARSKIDKMYKNMWEMKKKYFVLGEQDVQYFEPLVIVEGPGDMLAIKRAGFNNVVSLMGATMSIEQANKIERFTTDIIVWLDRDKAGYDGTYRIFNMLDSRLYLKFVNTSLMIGKDKEDPNFEKDAKDVYEKRGSQAVLDLIFFSQTYLEQKLAESEDFMH
jgi:DNA primase